ncbi:PIN domain-containing protein [bacterium]|nr:PIN domain-containing protein [bacterium]MBU1615545.1 PIN domain-containing protein [bacterium]
MKEGKVRVVLDTNVVLAYTWTESEDSPNKEIIRRWDKGQFDVLWSKDVINEYINKMKFCNLQ